MEWRGFAKAQIQKNTVTEGERTRGRQSHGRQRKPYWETKSTRWHVGGICLGKEERGWNSSRVQPVGLGIQRAHSGDGSTAFPPSTPAALLPRPCSWSQYCVSSSVLNGSPSRKVEPCLLAKHHNWNLPPGFRGASALQTARALTHIWARGSVFWADREVSAASIRQPAPWHLITTWGTAATPEEREEPLQPDLIQRGLCDRNRISSDFCRRKGSDVWTHRLYLLTRCMSMGFPMSDRENNSVGNSDCPPTAQMEWDTNSQLVQNKCYLLLETVLGLGCLSPMSCNHRAINSP